MPTSKKKTAPVSKAAPAKKSTTSSAKVPAPKPAAVKAPAEKAPAPTAPAVAKVTEPAVAKAPVKKAAAKKAAKAVVTAIIARVDVGFGNNLFIRGEGAGLSWENGILMECISSDEWAFTSKAAKTGIVYKLLVNDEIWAEGDDLTVPAGGTAITSPTFG